jgi:hypothetical protein
VGYIINKSIERSKSGISFFLQVDDAVLLQLGKKPPPTYWMILSPSEAQELARDIMDAVGEKIT